MVSNIVINLYMRVNWVNWCQYSSKNCLFKGPSEVKLIAIIMGLLL